MKTYQRLFCLTGKCMFLRLGVWLAVGLACSGGLRKLFKLNVNKYCHTHTHSYTHICIFYAGMTYLIMITMTKSNKKSNEINTDRHMDVCMYVLALEMWLRMRAS